MNEQAFTNALRALRGAPTDYPAPPSEREPWQVAIARLDELVSTLKRAGYMQSDADLVADKTPDELQVRVEMRVNELRELITTGELAL